MQNYSGHACSLGDTGNRLKLKLETRMEFPKGKTLVTNGTASHTLLTEEMLLDFVGTLRILNSYFLSCPPSLSFKFMEPW